MNWIYRIMTKNDETHFWSGGSDVHLKELKKQEEAELAPLQQKLEQTADPEDQKVLKQQIRQVKKNYRAKRKASGSSLF